VRTIASPTTTRAPRRSKRLLAVASDERLVQQVRLGNEAAFEVVFERYGRSILSFCRHMLGSQEEAEDAVQHTFASAYGDLQRDSDRELRLKPWLYTIARNRCLSMLRARRDDLHVDREPATAGLAEHVERRAELRELLGDIAELPPEQRAALLLAETEDLSHTEIADVLDCEVPRVKALVYRARSSLIERREARATPCEEIREQLAVLSGGSLRRSEIRYHLRTCSGCRAYREEIKRQRQLLAAVLPVVPPAWLKANVIGGGGGAAGGASAAAVGAGTAGPIGSGLLAKGAVLVALAAGGGAVTQASLEHHEPSTGKAPSASSTSDRAASSARAGRSSHSRSATSERAGRHSAGRKSERGKATKAGAAGRKHGRGPAEVPGSRGRGPEHRSPHADGVPHGRGPPAVPPGQAKPEKAPKKAPPAHPVHPTSPQAQKQGAKLPKPPIDNGNTAAND
jgi:RNA polymerase sigma factor (sigma-70 family)